MQVSQSWINYKDLKILGRKEEEGGRVVLDCEYSIQQKYELETGQPIKDHQWQVGACGVRMGCGTLCIMGGARRS